jgi:hypothetical protein
MAKYVLQNPVVEFTPTGGTAYGTISANVAQVTIALEADDIETTNFAGSGWRERIGGLKGGTFSIDVHQDMAAGSIDSQFWSSLGGTALVRVRPDGTAVSASSPRFDFAVLVNQINPVDGAVGDLSTQSISWPITGAVTRSTAA